MPQGLLYTPQCCMNENHGEPPGSRSCATIYLQEFLLNGPSQAVHYLVCMEEADGEITPVLGALRDALQAAVDALGRSDFEHRLGQMHFATQACSGISEAMSAIVAEWPPLFRANRQIEGKCCMHAVYPRLLDAAPSGR